MKSHEEMLFTELGKSVSELRETTLHILNFQGVMMRMIGEITETNNLSRKSPMVAAKCSNVADRIDDVVRKST